MPPRRSTRSVSVQPPPAVSAEKPSSKRKRTQAGEEDNQENIKPPSRARKTSAPPTSRTRTSARSRKSLEDVSESDEEQDPGAQPPIKKPRPSAEPEESTGEDEEEDEVKPIKGRRAPARKAAAPAVVKKGRGAAAKLVEVKEENIEVEVPIKGRRSNPPPKLSNGRPSRRSRSAQVVESEPDGQAGSALDSDFEDPKPPSRNPSRRSKKTLESADDGEHVDEPKPSRGSRKPPSRAASTAPSTKPRPPPRTAGPSRSRSKAKFVEVTTDDEELPPHPSSSHSNQIPQNPTIVEQPPSDDDAEADNVAALVAGESEVSDGGRSATQSRQHLKVAEPEDDEEEHSLLDPPVVLPPSQVQLALPEEPEGPKPRLVIHKMALVNFKSYAGRQEIGPFHKVCDLPYFLRA